MKIEPLGTLARTHTAGELTSADSGKDVVLLGWVHRVRDLGSLVFIDVRDRHGLTQVVARANDALVEEAKKLRSEFVVAVLGTVVARAADAVNPRMKTGEIEVDAREIRLLNDAKVPPFPIASDEVPVAEEMRLKYRYLDLRRPRMQHNIALRHRSTIEIRKYFDEHGFLEIETPMLTKSTPEGARDYLVPSRVHPGEFYALPQSPQQLKQLLMVSGLDRYSQIARCFRDEDLRADRVQEITQLDVEMAFPDQEFLFALMEQMIQAVWRDCLEVELETPFSRLTWADADARYGSDKPDLRFGLEIEDATGQTRSSEFGVFAGAPCVRFIRVPQAFSRAELERLEEVAKEWGAKGLAYLVWDEEGEVRSPIAKFLSEDELAGFRCDPGYTVLFAADEPAKVSRVLGALRLHLGRELGLVDEEAWKWVWITDFPMFEWSEEDERWAAVHHPFTRPAPGFEETFDDDPANALAHAYDLVGNGQELGGGSFRIHEADIQARVFSLLQLSPDEQRTKFGFLLDALAMGAPPHGGIAFGIDRMMMVLAREPNLRDVIAFPKNQAGADPMSGAPSEVEEEQLRELGIQLRPEARQESGPTGR